MSRTYRCRRLSKNASRKSWGINFRAKKVVDGSAGRHRIRAEIEARVNEIAGPRPAKGVRLVYFKGAERTEYRPKYEKDIIYDPKTGHWKWGLRATYDYVKMKGKWMKTQEYFDWERIENAIEADFVWPVAGWHPYQRLPSMGSKRKRNLRVRGNRAMRRKTRQIVHSRILDDDFTGMLPHKDIEANWADIY